MTALWSSLADTLALPDWQRQLLDERLAAAETEEGQDWEEIRAEIWPSAYRKTRSTDQ